MPFAGWIAFATILTAGIWLGRGRGATVRDPALD
jgi:hypothetical protein